MKESVQERLVCSDVSNWGDWSLGTAAAKMKVDPPYTRVYLDFPLTAFILIHQGGEQDEAIGAVCVSICLC